MKKMNLLTCSALIVVVLITSIGPVLAADFNLIEYNVSNKGKVWRMSTYDTNGDLKFNGKAVNEIHLIYWLASDFVERELVWTRIHKAEGKVTLSVSSKTLNDIPYDAPTDVVAGTRIEGTVIVGGVEKTFEVSGPGFAWRRTR